MRPGDPIRFAGRSHLESKIRQQRHEIANNQAKLRERNVRLRSWYDGREALLREMLAQERATVRNLQAQLARVWDS